MELKSKALAGLGAACLLAIASPTATAAAGTSSGTGTGTEGKHCVVDVTTGKTSCYQGFRDAVAAATGGRITDGPATSADAAGDADFERRLDALAADDGRDGTRANLVISIEYDWGYYQDNAGSVFYSAPTGCVSNGLAEWQLRNVGDDWNDRISSFHGYANCQVEHFEHADFGGARTGWQAASVSMSDTGLNNQATSIRWG